MRRRWRAGAGAVAAFYVALAIASYVRYANLFEALHYVTLGLFIALALLVRGFRTCLRCLVEALVLQHCAYCGYDLSGHGSTHTIACPECGQTYDSEAIKNALLSLVVRKSL